MTVCLASTKSLKSFITTQAWQAFQWSVKRLTDDPCPHLSPLALEPSKLVPDTVKHN